MTAESGRRTCFLHIGPAKTGTNTISQFVEGNAPELRRLGYFVPQTPSLESRPSNGHGVFAVVALDELDEAGRVTPDARLWPELEAAAAEGGKDIILTNEAFAFQFRDPEKLDRVLKFFERHGYDVRIIAYVRDQPDALNSFYAQTQKRLNARQTFDEYVAESAEIGRADPWRILENFIDNPRVTLDVGSYEAAKASGLEADFSRRIGLPADALTQPAPDGANPSTGAKTVYAAQRILQATEGPLPELDAYKKVLKRFRTHAETRGWSSDAYAALDDEAYRRIRDLYRERNERFAERFLGASWSDLAPDRTCRKNVFDPSAATQDELDEISAVVDDVVGAITKAQKLQKLKSDRPPSKNLLGRKTATGAGTDKERGSRTA